MADSAVLDSPQSQIVPGDDLAPEWAAFEQTLEATPTPAAPAAEPPPSAADVIDLTQRSPEPAPAPAPAPTPAPEPPPAPELSPDDVLKRARLDRLPPLNQLITTMLVRNPDMAPEQATALARQKLGLDPAPASPSPAATPEPAPAPAAAEPSLEEQLAEVQRQLDEAATEGGTGAIFDEHLNGLVREQARLMGRIEAENLLAEQRAAAAAGDAEAQFQASNEAAIAAAEQAYPDLTNTESPLAQAVMTEIAELTALQQQVASGDTSALADPDVALRYAEFQHPQYAELVAERHAKALGIPPAAGVSAAAPQTPVGQTPTAAPTAAPPAHQPQMLPVSGQNGVARVEVTPANPADSWKQDLTQVEDGDWAAMEKALTGAGDSAAPTVRILG